MKRFFLLFTLFFQETVLAEEAIFAMGCFWSAEASFTDEKNIDLKGIKSLKVGYAGGSDPNPTERFHKGHREVVHIVFDPALISYDKLLDLFWRNVDPFDGGGQFSDRGESYKIGIFYFNEAQRQKAEASKKAIEKKFGKQSPADILKAMPFYAAADYHQDYKKNNPIKYNMYEWKNGHIPGIQKIWGSTQ